MNFELRNLVLSGGGVRGMTFVGVWKYLKEKNLTKNLCGFAGSSAGALLALWCCMDKSPDEMEQYLNTLNGHQILQQMSLLSFPETWGLYDKEAMVRIIQTSLGPEIVTFRDLYEKTNKQFYVCVTRLQDSASVFLSHHNFPDLEVWRAVSASMSIPILFAPSIYQDQIWVDGGLTNNLPYAMFDLTNTLCVLLKKDFLPVVSWKDYVQSILYLTVEALEKQTLEKIPVHCREQHVLEINTGNTSSIDFLISPERKQELLELGYQKTKAFIQSQETKAKPWSWKMLLWPLLLQQVKKLNVTPESFSCIETPDTPALPETESPKQ